jgi:hypothetical protein
MTYHESCKDPDCSFAGPPHVHDEDRVLVSGSDIVWGNVGQLNEGVPDTFTVDMSKADPLTLLRERLSHRLCKDPLCRQSAIKHIHMKGK